MALLKFPSRCKIKLQNVFFLSSSTITLLMIISSIKVLNGTEFYQPCSDADVNSFSPRDGPLPVIVMALGKSGSLRTLNIISRLTGVSSATDEYTVAQTNNRAFFDEIDSSLGPRWPFQKLSCIQNRLSSENSTSGVAGIT